LPATIPLKARSHRSNAETRWFHAWLMPCMYGAMPNNIIFRCEPSLKQQAERIAAARDERLSQEGTGLLESLFHGRLDDPVPVQQAIDKLEHVLKNLKLMA